MIEKILNELIKGSDNTTNNAVKAILIGFIVGAIFVFWGEDFDFMRPYGISQGIVSSVVVTGGLFLKYKKTDKIRLN